MKPRARIRAMCNMGDCPTLMLNAPVPAARKVLEKAGLEISDIDLFEINEAFAAVLASAFHFLPELSQDRTNLWGSGISLGHPVGATAARQVVDMVHQLRRRDGSIGVTTRCVGGGMGSGEVIARL